MKVCIIRFKHFSFFTKSIGSVPIMRRTSFMGVIQFLNKQLAGVNETDVAILLVLGLVAGIVIEEF